MVTCWSVRCRTSILAQQNIQKRAVDRDGITFIPKTVKRKIDFWLSLVDMFSLVIIGSKHFSSQCSLSNKPKSSHSVILGFIVCTWNRFCEIKLGPYISPMQNGGLSPAFILITFSSSFRCWSCTPGRRCLGQKPTKSEVKKWKICWRETMSESSWTCWINRLFIWFGSRVIYLCQWIDAFCNSDGHIQEMNLNL